MSIIPLKASHAHDISALNIQGINTGFISSLGSDFAAALYDTIEHSIASFQKCGFEVILENHAAAGNICQAHPRELLPENRKTRDAAEVHKVSQSSGKLYPFEPKPTARGT